MTTLNLLYAQLELRFELLRAITPKYSKYSYKPSDQFTDYASSDRDPIAKVILRDSTGKINKIVNVDNVSTIARVKREDVVRKLQGWSDQGIIKLEPSGVVHRYRMIKPFPRRRKDIERLSSAAYEQMKAREEDDLRRSKQVIKLITSPKCFSLALAAHFGDEAPVCGKCQFCLTGKSLHVANFTVKKVPVDNHRVEAILAACKARDDPRLLARIAFGISSPRVTREKCGMKNPVFGSMDDCDFDVRSIVESIFLFSALTVLGRNWWRSLRIIVRPRK